MLPIRIKNSFLFKSPVTSLPITAACDELSPGRIQQRGEEIIVAKSAREIDLFFSVFFIAFRERIFCLGIFCFFRIEVIREDAPNKPVKRGRRGC